MVKYSSGHWDNISQNYVYEDDDTRPEDKPQHVKAEGKPGHKSLYAYNMPRWVTHPELPHKWIYTTQEDYHGCAMGGSKNDQKWTVAHVAASHNRLELLYMAPKHEWNARTDEGWTPAHFACHASPPALHVLYALKEAGIDIEEKNDDGETPFQCGQFMNITDMCRKITSVVKGAKPAGYDQAVREAQKGPVRKKEVNVYAEDKVPVALLFPGQGSQYVKMLADVKDHPVVKEMLSVSKTILGYDILDICLNGPESKLEETRYCQPAMYIGGLAALAKLRDSEPDKVERCQAVAGLSLGEYSALTAAGVFTFAEGLKLVKLRGEAMQKAAESSEQAMLSVAGLEEAKLDEVIEQTKKYGDVLTVANFLFPKGFSCAGNKEAIKRLEENALKAGAMQAKMLKTSGAFHTSFMSPAKTELTRALQDALPKMKPPKCTVYMNVTGKPMPPGTDPKKIVSMLADQLTSCVKWEPAMREMLSDGVSEVYELGPMKQLKAMMKRIDKPTSDIMINISV